LCAAASCCMFLGKELVGDFPAKREVIREENLAYSARPIFSRIL